MGDRGAMEYISGFRRPELIGRVLEAIKEEAGKLDGTVTFMEVCGTHTMAIARFGIRSMLPENIRLISGPGCPVCVTPNPYIDRAIAISRLSDVIVATFGDMMRVPGSSSSLERERANGADVRVVYSTIDALQIARDNPFKKVVFLGVGFETTAPTVASAAKLAREEGLTNFYILSAHKTIPPAMEALGEAEDVNLDGFICPGHVSTIIGSRPYEPIARKHKLPCVIAGFEPLDILLAVWMLLRQVNEGRAEVEIEYSRVVKPEGNPKAVKVMMEVFEPCDSTWRGIGTIPGSGLKLREEFYEMDAEEAFDVEVEPTREHPGCICGQILRGVKEPTDCPLFGKVCTPRTPVGACMVSSEGTCAAYYKYGVG